MYVFCMYAALERKIFNRIPQNSQHTYILGRYRNTQTPVYTGE